MLRASSRGPAPAFRLVDDGDDGVGGSDHWLGDDGDDDDDKDDGDDKDDAVDNGGAPREPSCC